MAHGHTASSRRAGNENPALDYIAPCPGHLTPVFLPFGWICSGWYQRTGSRIAAEEQTSGGMKQEKQLLTPCHCQALLSNTAVPILQNRKSVLGEDKAVSSPRPPFSRQPVWDSHPMLQDFALPLSGHCLRRENPQPRGGPSSMRTGVPIPGAVGAKAGALLSWGPQTQSLSRGTRRE